MSSASRTGWDSRERVTLDSYTDRRKKKERKKEGRRFSRFATRRSGASAMLYSKVNGPVAHGSTW